MSLSGSKFRLLSMRRDTLPEQAKADAEMKNAYGVNEIENRAKFEGPKGLGFSDHSTRAVQGYFSSTVRFRNGARVSMGMGKIVVEFFSAAISTRVWRYRS